MLCEYRSWVVCLKEVKLESCDAQSDRRVFVCYCFGRADEMARRHVVG